MQAIFSKYKERLINLGGRNISLVLKKIHKKRAFDLDSLNGTNAQLNEKIKLFLFEREKERLLILEDPYEIRIRETNKLDEKIKAEKQKILDQIKIDDENMFKEKSYLIDKKYEELKETETNKIEKNIKKIIDYSTSLTYLQREISAMEKETGLYELFIGYPFAEGKFKDGTFVKAPLLLFPVRIIYTNNKWYLENINEQEILINKVFVLGYLKYNETKITEFDTEFSSLEQFGTDVVEGVLEYLNNNKIKVQHPNSKEIEKFIDHTNQNLPNYNVGEIVLKNYLVLGQFPISNSIYNDYQALEEIKPDNTLLKKLLINDMTYEEPPGQSEAEENGKLEFSEKDLFFLTSLDYSQEKAVNKVNESDQLVVYGPPGTGKSQTIANIISDALAKGKKVLMVSQKRAALDVIFNRLSDIQSKIILIHDANKNKKDFYQKVTNILESMDAASTKNHKNSIIQRAKEIDEQIKCLDKIAITLHKPRDFGLTLQQMYSKSKGISSKSDRRYDRFKTFKRENSFMEYKYEDINAAISKVNGEDLIIEFRQYKNMLSQNPVLVQLKADFDFLQAEEVVDSVEQMLDAYNKIIPEINKKELQALLQLCKSNNYAVQEDELMKLAQNLNHEENSGLLIPINDGRWWSIKYWLEYKKNKEKEEENHKQYENGKKETGEELRAFNNKIQDAVKKLEVLNTVLKAQNYNDLKGKFFTGLDLNSELANIVQALGDYDDYKQLRFKLDTLSNLEKKLLEYCGEYSGDTQEFIELIKDILELTILSHIFDIEKLPEEQEGLKECIRYIELTKSIKKLMEEKNSLTPGLIADIWNGRINGYIDTRPYKEFKRQANKKRNVLPIRKYISEFNGLVFDTFPCWLLSPETVSDILPLMEGLFDIVIFDEASQIYIENAIPAIFRGRQVVVAGDDKQLKPNSLFRAKLDNFDEEETIMENTAALEEESLLDLAKVNYDSVHLNYHYRSRFDELINFSNYAFYSGKLQVSPNIVNTSTTAPPIQRIKVNGTWVDRKNIVEAEKAIELVDKIFKNRKHNETIGIITFNINQKDLIEDLLETKANSDAEFKAHYVNEIDRKDGNEDASMFVKNIENVQGDERDIVIFSVGYAPDEREKVAINFGSLSQDGGENRLNVAISRAKKRVYVITSIEPEQLYVDGTKNVGPKLFKKYLQYARAVSNGSRDEAKAILNSLIDSNIEINHELKYDSDFEKEVHDALVEKGYCVDTQVGVSGYKIDLAIYNKDTSRYICGIECDGAAFHSSKAARERDIHRQRYLVSRGWKIIRIWSRDWWKNHESEINKIEGILSVYKDSQQKAR